MMDDMVAGQLEYTFENYEHAYTIGMHYFVTLD